MAQSLSSKTMRQSRKVDIPLYKHLGISVQTNSHPRDPAVMRFQAVLGVLRSTKAREVLHA